MPTDPTPPAPATDAGTDLGPMRWLYVGTVLMERMEGLTANIAPVLECLTAVSESDAVGQATAEAMKKYPTGEGWKMSYVRMSRVHDWLVLRCADLIRREEALARPAPPPAETTKETL